MAKTKIAFVCTECGDNFTKWQGQCPSCKAWNTVQEFKTANVKSLRSADTRSGYAGERSQVQALAEINLEEMPRLSSTLGEFDRVLGGGLVKGSAVLIGGQPGAGKSTLLLQVMCALSQSHSALYVTGEESLQQVAMRAERLGLPKDKLQMLAETDVEQVCHHAQTLKPVVMVIDSIQVMYLAELQSAPGSVAQVRESAAALVRFAKQTGTILFIVGHVTKEGSLAGPKVLEHMIDTAMLLEGSADSRFRTLRGYKNRFGAVNELGVFAMAEQGLKEVKNPSAIFLSRHEEAVAGSVVMVVWEGTRPLLVEIQALVDEASMGYPKRLAVGLEQNRLNLLLAVLHRHGGLHLSDQDVFANVVGGVKVLETSADLAVLLAMVSSFRNMPLPREMVVFGEVGLSGEIRPVPSGQERLQEAAKHGFKKAIVPKGNAPKTPPNDMQVHAVSKLSEALDVLF